MVRSSAYALTRSLAELRTDALAIAAAGIRACDAGRLVETALRSSRLAEARAWRVLSAGKAAYPMAAAASRVLGEAIRAGLVISSYSSSAPERFTAIVGGHPVPTEASEEAGRRALAMARDLETDERLLVLVSGGASALMVVPAEGLSLADKRATTDRLLRAGADIHALNTVRKHVSAIKGGQLAAAAQGRCDALVISDVVGDDLSVIASGPTMPDASRFEDAFDVLQRFGGADVYPPAVVTRFERGLARSIADTPKPGDPRFANSTTTLIGSRRNAMRGAVDEAIARGYVAVPVDDAIVGEARRAGAAHLRAVLASATTVGRPACFVSSGETTVTVTGRGKGGRNQEFALAAAEVLGQLAAPAAIASVGTDGIDGPTDAAGAFADGQTISRALADGLLPDRYLADNNAYAFFAALGDLIHTGPTGTNVGDLQVILLA